MTCTSVDTSVENMCWLRGLTSNGEPAEYWFVTIFEFSVPTHPHRERTKDPIPLPAKQNASFSCTISANCL